MANVVQNLIPVMAAAVFGMGSSLHAAAYFQDVINSGPVAYYRLGEASGTAAKSLVNNGATQGTYVNSPTLGVIGALPADPDTAMRTANLGQKYMQTPFLFNPSTTSWTVELWFNLSSTPSSLSDWEILSQQDSSPAPKRGRSWMYTSANNGFSSFFNGAEQNWGAGAAAIDAWTYVAMTFTYTGPGSTSLQSGAPTGLGTLKWYKNGVNTSTNSVAIESTNGGMMIGIDRNGDNGTGFVGGIDEPAFYTSALSDATILSHFTDSTVPVPEPASLTLLAGGGLLLRRKRAVR